MFFEQRKNDADGNLDPHKGMKVARMAIPLVNIRDFFLLIRCISQKGN